MRPTEVLMKEHEAIMDMLRVLGGVCDKLESKDVVPPDHLATILSFLKGYADQCHHGKEEDLLFPAMEQAGVPREGGPIGVMLTEHAQGRDYIQQMTRAVSSIVAGSPEASTSFVQAARDYVVLLRQHIEKENNILFRMGDMHLSEPEQQRLEMDFERVNRDKIGLDRIEQHLQELSELKNTYL